MTYLAELSPEERRCFARGMEQWQKSLQRPDMTERDRVAGALLAYSRQALAQTIVRDVLGPEPKDEPPSPMTSL
jgi:hypothetical protein